MLLRRALPATLAAAAVTACQPSVPGRTSPGFIDYLVFDPATSDIPLPNDLALVDPAETRAACPGAPTAQVSAAQGALLQAFRARGGFPSDQESPILLGLQRWELGAGAPVKAPPPAAVDLATVDATPGAAGTILILQRPAGSSDAPTPFTEGVDPVYVSGTYAADRGTLELHRKSHAVTLPTGTIQSRRWDPATQYVVVVRGGAGGVKLQDGSALTQMPTMYLLTRGVDLTDPRNQYLLPGPGRPGRAVTGCVLERIRTGYASILGLARQTWSVGPDDIAAVLTFTTAPAAQGAAVATDTSAGQVPLPSDLLLDPATGKVVNNPAFGSAASGLATLDGFSTTAMLLSQTTAPVAVASVTKDSVFLYDLSDPAHPARVQEASEGAGAGFRAEPLLLGKTPGNAPCTSAALCFSTAIGLQPGLSLSEPTFLPPLKEGTEYAVLVSDGVKDATGAALQRSTLSTLLLLGDPLVDSSGNPLVSGQPIATLQGLERIRQGVAAAAAALGAEKGVAASSLVLGYTVKTQSISETALQLAAAPYASPAAFVPGTPAAIPPASYPLAAPSAQEILLVPVPTLDPIDVTTGALEPDSARWTPAALQALVVVPSTSPSFPGATLPACPAPASELRCAPLVVFQHGITRTKADVFAIAEALASAGFVAVAVDAPLHGDRALCTQDAECSCATFGAAGFAGAPGTCTQRCELLGPAGLQGDAVPIGRCASGSVADPAVSGRFAVTQNLFRTRDAIRQDLLDSSALVLALAPTAPRADPLSTELASKGIAVDGAKVYWLGQSLGGILGTLNLASNPRFSRGVLNAPGAPLLDTLTNSPSFTGAQPGEPPVPGSPVGQLLAAQGIEFGSPEYLQFVQVAKWILDPADPANFARHVTADTFANPLATSPAAQEAKDVFGQYAECDQTIPNLFSRYLFDQLGLASNAAPNGFTRYTVNGAAEPACTGASAAHGFLLTATDQTANGQADAVRYLLDLTVPTSNR